MCHHSPNTFFSMTPPPPFSFTLPALKEKKWLNQVLVVLSVSPCQVFELCTEVLNLSCSYFSYLKFKTGTLHWLGKHLFVIGGFDVRCNNGNIFPWARQTAHAFHRLIMHSRLIRQLHFIISRQDSAVYTVVAPHCGNIPQIKWCALWNWKNGISIHYNCRFIDMLGCWLVG